jgi:3-oxoacyl-[acyl-carrier protein] reductase
MDLELQGRVALVTGGSEGIGRAIALRLAREGALVAVCARRADVLARAAREIADASGAEVLPVPADVTQDRDVELLFQAVRDRFGGLEILVNNAGAAGGGPFESMTVDRWQQDLDLKVLGAVRCARLAAPLLRAAGGGSIVNIVANFGKTPPARSLPSSASRAAGLALTKALSLELAADKIRVNAVCVGVVKSAQHKPPPGAADTPAGLEAYYAGLARDFGVPLGRVAEAEEVGDLVAFLVSARAAYLTGAAINFDGGMCAVL